MISLQPTCKADAHAAYDAREEALGAEVLRELERRVLLSVLDRKWREHLYEMDYLREGIGLRAYSQRDPLVEYQREGFDLFSAMMDSIKEESVGYLFNVEVTVNAEEEVLEEDVEHETSTTTTTSMSDPISSPRVWWRRRLRASCRTPRRRSTAMAAPRCRRPQPRSTSSPESHATILAPAARVRSSSDAMGTPRVVTPDAQRPGGGREVDDGWRA